jgi:hypothetical protein
MVLPRGVVLRPARFHGVIGMTSNPGLAGATAALCLFALGGAALAQTSVYRSVNAASGKSVRVRVVTNLKKDCTVGAPASIRVVTPPKNGSLVVKNGKLKTPADYRCPNVETPVQAVFYQSNPKYTGSDEVAFEVKTAEGPTQSISIKINVGDKPAAAPKEKDGVDL